MKRSVLGLAALALTIGTAAPATAGSYRAGPLGAWDQNGEFSCEGGQVILFPEGQFGVIPYDDDPTAALIDSRRGRAKVGGNTARELEALIADPAICAGPIDCDDWEGLDSAIEQCWHTHGDGPPPPLKPL
jgi:hypothetical protein